MDAASIQAMLDRMDRMQRDINKNSTELTNVKSDNVRLNTELTNVKSELRNAKIENVSDNTDLCQRLQNARRRLDETQETVRQKDEELRQKDEELRQKDAELRRIKAELEELKRSTTIEIGDLKRKLEKAIEDLVRLGVPGNAAAEINKLQQELRVALTKMDTWNSQWYLKRVVKTLAGAKV